MSETLGYDPSLGYDAGNDADLEPFYRAVVAEHGWDPADHAGHRYAEFALPPQERTGRHPGQQ